MVSQAASARPGGRTWVAAVGKTPTAPTAPPAPRSAAPASPAIAPVRPVASSVRSGRDFVEQARELLRVGACSGSGHAQVALRPAFRAKHCRGLRRAIRRYRQGWLERATLFFRSTVPSGLPRTVVYPFGGADLVTALAVFPDAEEITTISLEPAGDPRAIEAMPPRQLERALVRTRRYIAALLRANHSRTVDIGDVSRHGRIPGHLIFTLVALSIHGYEPVSLRYFEVGPDGGIHYLDEGDLAVEERASGAAAAGSHASVVAARKRFSNMELEFRRVGSADAPVKVYRHIRANLADDHLGKDDRVLRHLRAKGRVTAMTKAASYLLWRPKFSRIRNYLLRNMEWMISDATGIPPHFALAAGFEQETYGRWRRHIRNVKNPGKKTEAEFRRLWSSNAYRPLRFRFGYPDGSRGANHLLITRRRHHWPLSEELP